MSFHSTASLQVTMPQCRSIVGCFLHDEPSIAEDPSKQMPDEFLVIYQQKGRFLRSHWTPLP
jgi:hypothetical protein